MSSKLLERLRELPITVEQIRLQQARAKSQEASFPAVTVFDSAGFADAEVKNDAGAVVQVWAGTSAADLDDGETLIDRLIAMLVEMAAPESSDDEPLSDGQEEMATTYMHAAAAYMVGKGAAEGDVVAMFDGDDTAAAGRVHEFLSGEFSGDDSDLDDLHGFAFSDDEQAAVFDSIGVLDAVYKQTAVVRNGKKLLLKRRVSGTVRRSGAQKIAIKRAQMKSRSSGAKLKRAKSMRVRMKMGL
jgi:hypothetical protein